MIPKILNCEQGSTEWLALRKTCLTASDLSVIMGMNPWKSCLTLWEEKLGLREPEKVNERMKEGSRLEILARDYFNKTHNTDFEPVVLQHGDINYFMASLDGINSKGEILEIKCGQGSHTLALQGVVPEYYQTQIQWQMMCSNTVSALYFSYRSDEDNVLMKVDRDDELIERMIVEADKFYQMLQNFTPPPLCDKDFIKRDSRELQFHVEIWKQNKEELKRLEAKDELLRDTIVRMCENQSSECNGVRIAKTVRRGNIEYAKIEMLKNIDLEKYRGKSTTSFRFTEIK